jgi:hypothetical protein
MTSASLALFFENNWDQALVDLKIASQLARASRQPEALLALALFLGQEFTLLKGGLDLLEDFCLEIRAQIGEQFTPVQLGINDVLAFIHLRRGRLAEAIQAGERALAVKEHLGGYPFIGLNAALVTATARAAQRDYHSAGLYLQQMLREIDPLPLNRFTLAGGYYPLFRLLCCKIAWRGRLALDQLYHKMEDDPTFRPVLVGNICVSAQKG